VKARLCGRGLRRATRREALLLQLLRLQVKETCKHESSTQAQWQKVLQFFTAPKFNKTSNKNDFAFLACRAWWLYGERCIKTIHVFLL
jgi:hypothetical protein